MKIDVLDHGFVRLVESWGGGDFEQLDNEYNVRVKDNECGIIEAARQSTKVHFVVGRKTKSS